MIHLGRTGGQSAARLARAVVVSVLSMAFLSRLFQLFQPTFWNTGLGDWADPYFINYLLEHWYRSVVTFGDPFSPPMFFPARGTLGYSHGLILYAPIYGAFRPFFHPFQAYSLMLLVVLEAGVVALYVLFRKILRLSFLEALILTAFFATSQNVVNGFIGVWSQRASVFLIPPILLILLLSIGMRPGRGRVALASLAGLLCALLFTQDFYTAQFAMLLAVLGAAPLVAFAKPSLAQRLAGVWNSSPLIVSRVAIVAVAMGAAWALAVGITSGGSVEMAGIRISSRDWHRPALIAAVVAAAFACFRTIVDFRPRPGRTRGSWFLPFMAGACTGAVLFLWIYLGPYLEHPVFAESDLLNSLVLRDPSAWTGPMDFIRSLSGHESLRTFTLVFVAAALAWLPWFRVDRRTRLVCLWCAAVSFVVLLIPLGFGDLSIWKTLFQPLPGLSVIRDPKRIEYLYDLAAVLAIAVFLARLPRGSTLRASIVVVTVLLLVTQGNGVVLDFLRPNESYDRWVDAPVAIDPACRSFFIKPASARYTARSNNRVTLYAIDSMFVALNHSIPTLNGYSAWSPQGWGLTDPEATVYPWAVSRWVAQHQLADVCELDIESRVMRVRPSPSQ